MDKKKNLKPAWKKGDPSPNPNGRPNGQRNYSTIYREALMKIAETRDMTPEQVETLMEQVGLVNALKGDFKFWQDVRDRIHGKPTQAVEHSGPEGGDIPVVVTVKYE